MSSKFKLKHYEKPEKGQNNEQNILLAVGFEVDFSSLFFSISTAIHRWKV